MPGFKNILLAGPPRVGKTTVVQKVLARARARFGGFFSQAVDQAAVRRDFRLITVQGRNRSISRKRVIRRFELTSLIGLDVADLESRGISAIRQALERCQVVVIDEIGLHQTLSGPLQQAVLRALDSERPVLGTVPLHGTPFIEGLKARPDTLVFEVTTENRVLLPDRVARELNELVRSRDARQLPGAAEEADNDSEEE
jgi:nucleoside-triphosphatase